MSDWLSYSLSDFLLFSPQTYYRLFELYNQAIWPGQILALALGLTILGLLRGGGTAHGRFIAGILALGCLWVAWAYLWQRYDTINWAARYFALGFAIEAILLIAAGPILGRLRFRMAGGATAWFGLGLFVFALAAQPFIGTLLGRSWTQVEIFGIAPDPTILATLGLLLLTTRIRWDLLVIPLLWCALTGATHWAMKSPDALLMPAAAVLVLVLAARRSLSGLPRQRH